MTRHYKLVLAELESTTEQTRRNELLAEFGSAMEQLIRRSNEETAILIANMEYELRNSIAGISENLVALRALENERTLESRQQAIKAAQDLEDRRAIVNAKLHQISNFIQALDNKLNEQAEIIHNLLFNDANKQ